MTTALPLSNLICPACAQGFACGMVAGATQCWCYALPHQLPVPARAVPRTDNNALLAGCFCPACLQLRLNMSTADANVRTTAPTDPNGLP